MSRMMNRDATARFTDRKIIVGYARVSTPKQGETGISLDGQKAAIRAFANELGVPILEIFEDVASGYDRSNRSGRPGLKRALEACRDRDAILVVWDWSRLSRDADAMRDLKDLFPTPDRIRSLKEEEDLARATKRGRIVHAQHEREEISRRTKNALEKMRQQGQAIGNPYITAAQPIGAATFKAQSEALVRRIADVLRDLPGFETMTTAEIAGVLNARGLRTGQGKDWNKVRLRLPLAKAKALIVREATDTAAHEANPNFGLF